MKYSRTHEWVEVEEDDTCVVGITEQGLTNLDTVLSISLPKIGQEVLEGSEVGTIETEEDTNLLHTPISGTIIDVNSELLEHPELFTTDHVKKIWLFKLEPYDITDIKTLMDEDEYNHYII